MKYPISELTGRAMGAGYVDKDYIKRQALKSAGKMVPEILSIFNPRNPERYRGYRNRSFSAGGWFN